MEPLLGVTAQHRPVGLLEHLAADGRAAGQVADIIRVVEAKARAVAHDAVVVDAEQQQARLARLALDAGVGGEGGGQAGQLGLAAQVRVQAVQRV